MFIEAANETKTENQALFGFVGGEKVEIVGDVGAPYTATGGFKRPKQRRSAICT